MEGARRRATRAWQGERGGARVCSRRCWTFLARASRSFRAAARETRSSSWPASDPDEIDRRLALAGGQETGVTIDTEHFRAELLEHRERAAGHDQAPRRSATRPSTEETGELMSSSADNHLADTASETYERELDEGLEEDAREQLRQVDEALARIEAGTYGTCSTLRQGDPGRAARSGAVDDALHRRRTKFAELTEPARRSRRRRSTSGSVPRPTRVRPILGR